MNVPQPKIQWLSDTPLVVLLQDWRCDLPCGAILEVDAGFQYDGASVPRWAWTLAGHPFAQDTLPAATAHDALYAAQLYDRGFTDRIFKRHLDASGASYRKRKIYWAAVRVGGRRAWRRRTEADREFYREMIRVVVP